MRTPPISSGTTRTVAWIFALPNLRSKLGDQGTVAASSMGKAGFHIGVAHAFVGVFQLLEQRGNFRKNLQPVVVDQHPNEVLLLGRQSVADHARKQRGQLLRRQLRVADALLHFRIAGHDGHAAGTWTRRKDAFANWKAASA